MPTPSVSSSSLQALSLLAMALGLRPSVRSCQRCMIRVRVPHPLSPTLHHHTRPTFLPTAHGTSPSLRGIPRLTCSLLALSGKGNFAPPRRMSSWPRSSPSAARPATSARPAPAPASTSGRAAATAAPSPRTASSSATTGSPSTSAPCSSSSPPPLPRRGRSHRFR